MILKEKFFLDQGITGKAFVETVILPKVKQMLTQLNITFTEFGFNGNWFTAGSTHAENFCPDWLKTLGQKAYTVGDGKLDWLPGAQGAYSISEDYYGSPNYGSAKNKVDYIRAVYGGIWFTINNIRYAILSTRSNIRYTSSGYNYNLAGSDTYGNLALVIDGSADCDCQIGGSYETMINSFQNAYAMGIATMKYVSDSDWNGWGFLYDTFEFKIIKTDVSFFMNFRVCKNFQGECFNNFISVGHFKMTPFFDGSSIGDIYYLYPTRRVTKMHLISSVIDKNKIGNFVTDKTLFDPQMHPTLGDKISGKIPLYNWYVGYDTYGMIGRIEGIYGTLQNYGKDYVLLDGVQYQAAQCQSYLIFGNSNVLKTT